jgi:hypothetical protein
VIGLHALGSCHLSTLCLPMHESGPNSCFALACRGGLPEMSASFAALMMSFAAAGPYAR